MSIALPPDNHVHTEWSWDAVAGSMENSCRRAIDTGLPSIAFTEHVDRTRMIEASGVFAVLAHIDYPIRHWPDGGPSFDPSDFEEEFRTVLRSLSRSGRALEVNTVVPLRQEVVRWWYEEGGDAVSFGSDAHAPEVVARGFADAAAMVEAQGFSPGRDPDDFWRRHP